MSMAAKALFKANRRRDPATARYSIRRAGGGSSVMARSKFRARATSASGAGRFLRRRRDDRLSDLSDDLLLLVLRRLDTRTALGAGLISRRWSHLPRELPALHLKVSDILPPRYHRWVLLHRHIYTKGTYLDYRRHAMRRELVPNIKRYERRAMRALNSSVEGLLGGGPRRGVVKRLSLEFYTTGNGCCMNRLITEAIDDWGVHDLEVIAEPLYNETDVVHAFPSHGMCKEPRLACLRSLKLGGCVLPPPLQEYTALTMLVLQDIPESTPPAAYEAVFASCPKLQTLHLISCGCRSESGTLLPLVVDAPSSEMRELVVDKCTFRLVRLRALPCLESLTSVGSSLSFFDFNLIPSLRQCNFALRLGTALEGARQYFAQLPKLELDMFLRFSQNLTSLIVRFTGPDRWIVPSNSPLSYLPNLRRLLVADVPSSWDAAWPCIFLDMTPSLEVLHISIASCKEKPGQEISWQPSQLRQHHLRELVVAGFEGSKRQIYLVNFFARACTGLRHVAVFKNGHAREKGLWDWEMVTQQHSWTADDKYYTLKKIMDGVSNSALQLVLG